MFKQIYFLLPFSLFNLPAIIKAEPFKLIITLYNEKNEQRIAEYLKCLEINLANEYINHQIHVVYDTSKDDEKTVVLNYLKSKQLPITYVNGRATYSFCFDLANRLYPNGKIILANADIYFNDTLKLLNNYDFTNTLLALTRWEIKKDGSLYLREDLSCSQDVWIFSTPLHCQNANIKMGTAGCDQVLAFYAKKSGLIVLNPCISIQTFHEHESGIRNYDPIFTGANETLIHVPYSKIS